MPKQYQYQLSLIQHEANGSPVKQRRSDGYVNATELCEAAGKSYAAYEALPTTANYLAALSKHTRLPEPHLVQSIASYNGRSTVWVHPKVALHLGQWLSPEFAVQVSEWVYGWLGDGAKPSKTSLPPHLQRYVTNDSKIEPGYFSILQETALSLFGPLNHAGFDIPKDWVPDISVGKAFCKWLRDIKGVDTESLPSYEHDYCDGRPLVDAKMYPDELLADFRRWFRTHWLPKYGVSYFKRKDPDSLAYLDRIPALAGPRRS